MELLEGFNDLMGWRSPETMATYLKTMNKRQAIQVLLEDEEAQEKAEKSPLTPLVPISGQAGSGSGQKPVSLEKTQALLLENKTDEFDWYEDEE